MDCITTTKTGDEQANSGTACAQVDARKRRLQVRLRDLGPGPGAAVLRYANRIWQHEEKDGDDYLYRGRTGTQLTGKDNYRQFRGLVSRRLRHRFGCGQR